MATARATVSDSGKLYPIPNCELKIAGQSIQFNTMPQISDGKGAQYSEERIIGRSNPYVTYSHSDSRIINMEVAFITTKLGGSTVGSLQYNINAMRLIESAVYPRDQGSGCPYKPPPICYLECGDMLSSSGLCVVLEKYNTKNDPNIPCDPSTLFPYKLSVSMTFRVVYESSDMPGQERVWREGR